jgi:PAP2 superfamily.
MLSDCLQIDRQVLLWFNGSDSIFLDGVVTTLTSGLSWLPLFVSLFYIVIKNNDTMTQIWVTIGFALLCLFLTDGLSDGIVKPLVARPRPLNDPFFKDSVDAVVGYGDRHYSFFSAHAANTFGLAVFLSFLVRQRLATTVLIVWSLLNCWTRLYLGVHYPSDVLVGLLWGGIVGCGIYLLSRKYVKVGYEKKDAELITLMFSVTLLYSVVHSLVFLLLC